MVTEGGWAERTWMRAEELQGARKCWEIHEVWRCGGGEGRGENHYIDFHLALWV